MSGLLRDGAVSRLMMTLLAVSAVAAAVLASNASQRFALGMRGEVRAGEVGRVIEHHGKTTSHECVIRYRGATKAPGGPAEPGFAEAKGTYRFIGVLALGSAGALVLTGEFTVISGVVLRAARRVAAARGAGTDGGLGVAGGR